MRSSLRAGLLLLVALPFLGACAGGGTHAEASKDFEQRADKLESARVSAMRGIQNDMTLKDDELRKELAELKVNYEQLERYLETLKEENATLKARIEAHAADTSARLEGLDATLAEIKAKREENGEAYHQVMVTLEKVGEFSSRLSENETKLLEMQRQADQLEADLSAESDARRQEDEALQKAINN